MNSQKLSKLNTPWVTEPLYVALITAGCLALTWVIGVGSGQDFPPLWLPVSAGVAAGVFFRATVWGRKTIGKTITAPAYYTAVMATVSVATMLFAMILPVCGGISGATMGRCTAGESALLGVGMGVQVLIFFVVVSGVKLTWVMLKTVFVGAWAFVKGGKEEKGE